MEFTWDSSFKPFFRYTILSSLPPYTNHYKMGYLTTFIVFLTVVRSIPLLLTEKEFFAEMFYMITATSNMLLRSIIFLRKRKSFHDLSYEMNKFISDHKFNPIIGEEDCFLNIWRNNSVFKHAKYYFLFLIMMIISYQLPVYYDAATNLKNVEYPYYPYYSPYFEYNFYTKAFYTIMDLTLDWICVPNLAHNEMVFMSMTGFLYCQYLYLKKLIDEISGEIENKPEKVKWWIENHCRVIRFTKTLQNLLGPIIIVNYICLIGSIASCIFIINETSVQTLHQKYVTIILFSIFLFEIGCRCHTMEKVNEINKTMHENIYPLTTKGEKCKINTVYRMIDFMSKKPVRLSGVGFFTFNNNQFRELLFQTYSFYSSLASIKKKK